MMPRRVVATALILLLPNMAGCLTGSQDSSPASGNGHRLADGEGGFSALPSQNETGLSESDASLNESRNDPSANSSGILLPLNDSAGQSMPGESNESSTSSEDTGQATPNNASQMNSTDSNLSSTPPLSSEEQDTPGPSAGILKVFFLNVGQGDATVWQMPDGSIIVYDCGPPVSSAGESPLVALLAGRLGLDAGTKIHALIVSHGHLDHLGGCEELVNVYRVGHIYDIWYEGADGTQANRIFQEQARREGAVLHTVGSSAALNDEETIEQWEYVVAASGDDFAGAQAQFVWPPNEEPPDWDYIEDSSLVVRLSYRDLDFCFQGDIGVPEESVLAALARDLSCEVYLVGHHGSSGASSATWLAKMRPSHAVVSFGSNSYGHPTAQALCRVQTAGAAVYATHALGTILVTTDGRNLSVEPARPEIRDYCAPDADYWTGVGGSSPVDSNQTTDLNGSYELVVTADVSDEKPCRYNAVTVSVRVSDDDSGPVPGAGVTTTWNYKTTRPTETATTDEAGLALVTRNIGGATAGYQVIIEVEVTKDGTRGRTTTAFTPESC